MNQPTRKLASGFKKLINRQEEKNLEDKGKFTFKKSGS